MKRSELKDIIKECIQEMGLTEPADKFDVWVKMQWQLDMVRK